MKVSKLEGAELDYWVARVVGLQDAPIMWMRYCNDLRRYVRETSYTPSTDWTIGGPIIERERISIEPEIDGTYTSDTRQRGASVGNGYACETGPTPLIAAMRCFVASKFGDTVEDSPGG